VSPVEKPSIQHTKNPEISSRFVSVKLRSPSSQSVFQIINVTDTVSDWLDVDEVEVQTSELLPTYDSLRHSIVDRSNISIIRVDTVFHKVVRQRV